MSDPLLIAILDAARGLVGVGHAISPRQENDLHVTKRRSISKIDIQSFIRLLDKADLRSPVSAEDLEALRDYAVGELPKDYVEFLQISDGYEGGVCPDGWIRIWSAREAIEYDALYDECNDAGGTLLVGRRAAVSVLAIDFRRDSVNNYTEFDYINMDWAAELGSWQTLPEMILNEPSIFSPEKSPR